MIGTAPPARRWLLVEQPAGWGRSVLESIEGPGLDRAALVRALDAAGARLQLIRRPGGRPQPAADGRERRWAVIDTEPPRGLRWGTLADGWESVYAALGSPIPSGGGEPILLVCTNGRHDPCCAVRGRPVAAALAAAHPEWVWETTHTGGDRFAANLVVLPEGVCYGGLDPDIAVDVIAAHLRGEPNLMHLRGVTGRPPQDQAALIVVAQRVGVPPWERARLTVRPHRASALGRGQRTAAPTGAESTGDIPPSRARGWSREVLLDGTVVAVVHGHTAIRPAQLLTCAATEVSRAAVPTVDEVELR